MKRVGELMGSSNQRFPILGGRTLAENYEWWLDRCRRDANIGGANWVRPPDVVEPGPPERGDEDEQLRRHLERCGVPDRIGLILMGKLDETHPVQTVRQWWGLGTSFILIHGATGRGKSVAAASALLRMKRTVRWDGGERTSWDSSECAFETANELAGYGYFSEEGHQLLDHLGKVTCLVLDDLGAEMMSESWRATLDALLSERFGRTRCRTILTTNMSARRPTKDAPSPFEERYGARIARRIRESGTVVAVEAER